MFNFKRTLITGILALACTATTALADVRVLHLSPGTPNVDVFIKINNHFPAKILSDVPYPAASAYLPVPTGTYSFAVAPVGGLRPVLGITNIALDGATKYSAAAVNTLDKIEALLLVDDNKLDQNNARVRIVHASPNAGPVDIYVDEVGSTPVVTNLAFKSSTAYLTLPPNSYTIRIFAAGTNNQVFVVNGLALKANTVYSAFAIGLLNNPNTPFGVLPVVDAAGN